MKAEAILSRIFEGEEEEEVYDDGFVDFDYEYDDGSDELPVEVLEEPLRLLRRRVKRITTLRDLIEELKRAEEVERRRRRRLKTRQATLDEPLRYPHSESMEETIAWVERELLKMLKRSGTTTLFSIAGRGDVGKLIDYYVSILHLVLRRKIEIKQERIFEDDIIITLPTSSDI